MLSDGGGGASWEGEMPFLQWKYIIQRRALDQFVFYGRLEASAYSLFVCTDDIVELGYFLLVVDKRGNLESNKKCLMHLLVHMNMKSYFSKGICDSWRDVGLWLHDTFKLFTAWIFKKFVIWFNRK